MDTEGWAITARNLRKAYGDRVAVDDVSLDVRRGDIFALLGPNGAGKTTTVEILEGYRRRDGGRVSVLGVDPARGDAGWRARCGIVLQSTGEFDDLTVGEVVTHFAALYPRPADPARVVDQVGLADHARRRTRLLSGGQKRRLDVALGIVGQPELLFLDEPTTGFDPQARREFWELIRGLAAGGTTILLTTHYLDEAEALADQVAVLRAGRIVEAARPAELGGRHSGEALVTWRDPDGTPRQQRTATPTALVAQLAAAHPGEVPELTVARPSLEDTYLRMIGADA